MVECVKKECNTKARDKVRVSITHPNLNFGIHVPCDDAEALTGERLLNEVEKVAQSSIQFQIHDGDTQLEITHISMPEGEGRTNRHYGSNEGVSNVTKLKHSIVQIQNA